MHQTNTYTYVQIRMGRSESNPKNEQAKAVQIAGRGQAVYACMHLRGHKLEIVEGCEATSSSLVLQIKVRVGM